jgi:hypothetical protein
VRQLIDQRHLRAASQDGIKIHLRQLPTPVSHPTAGNDLQPFCHYRDRASAVRLHESDHAIGALAYPAMALCQHLVGLTDPGGSAEVDT